MNRVTDVIESPTALDDKTALLLVDASAGQGMIKLSNKISGERLFRPIIHVKQRGQMTVIADY